MKRLDVVDRQPIDLLVPLGYPTVLSGERMHESLTRSWAVIDRVIWLLQQGTPALVTLSYIQSMREAEPKEMARVP